MCRWPAYELACAGAAKSSRIAAHTRPLPCCAGLRALASLSVAVIRREEGAEAAAAAEQEFAPGRRWANAACLIAICMRRRPRCCNGGEASLSTPAMPCGRCCGACAPTLPADASSWGMQLASSQCHLTHLQAPPSPATTPNGRRWLRWRALCRTCTSWPPPCPEACAATGAGQGGCGCCYACAAQMAEGWSCGGQAVEAGT